MRPIGFTRLLSLVILLCGLVTSTLADQNLLPVQVAVGGAQGGTLTAGNLRSVFAADGDNYQAAATDVGGLLTSQVSFLLDTSGMDFTTPTATVNVASSISGLPTNLNESLYVWNRTSSNWEWIETHSITKNTTTQPYSYTFLSSDYRQIQTGVVNLKLVVTAYSQYPFSYWVDKVNVSVPLSPATPMPATPSLRDYIVDLNANCSVNVIRTTTDSVRVESKKGDVFSSDVQSLTSWTTASTVPISGLVYPNTYYFRILDSAGRHSNYVAIAPKQMPADETQNAYGFMDAPLASPSWASSSVSSDGFASPADGPAGQFSVEPAFGSMEVSGLEDISVRNPYGTRPSFARIYRNTHAFAAISSPGLPPGWTHNWDLTIVQVPDASGPYGLLKLIYPDGASETLTPVVVNGFATGALQARSGFPYTATAYFAGYGVLNVTLSPGGNAREVFQKVTQSRLRLSKS